ncbi:MAG: heavy metal-associated domain-containing protein [Terrisporobacter sp.]|uniref:heavy-metal-associated domain-containing protein n=1 Tax=Terrisporobacter sp. TaxID=1965305 RepID=UPI002FCC6857
MKKKLLIEGMKCKHCVGNLQDALTEDITGVEVLEINLENKYAVVDINEDVNLNDIKNIVEDLGFNLLSVE